eukprot:2211888-Amphidinium_carterae.2
MAQSSGARGYPSNCKSFEDAGMYAVKEIRRLAVWGQVIAQWRTAVVSKVAAILKPRDDGDIKIRFVLDFRRSGVNWQLEVPGRAPLPW